MVRKWYYRVISCVLSVLMFLSIAGCSNPTITGSTDSGTASSASTEESEPVVETPTIDIFIGDEGQSKWSSEIFTMKKLAEAGGVKFNLTAIPNADMGTKLTAALASDTLPDIMYVNSSDPKSYDVMMEYGPKGIFKAVDEYIEDMPSLKKYVDKYPEFNKVMTASDGHIYGFPLIQDYPDFSSGPMVREKILTDNGINLSDVKTLDDYYNMLTVLKEKGGGKAPWLSRKLTDFTASIGPMFGTGKNMYFNPKQDKFLYGPTDANFKIMVDFLAKCYANGILHPDIFQLQDQTMEQMFFAGEGHFVVDNLNMGPIWGPDSDGGTKPSSSPLVAILPPEINGTRYYASISDPYVRQNKLWLVSSKTEYIDNIVKMVDWGYSDEGAAVMSWGIEGEHYQVNDKGYREFIFPSGGFSDNWPNVGLKLESVYDLGLYRGFNIFVWTRDSFEFKQAFGETGSNYRKLFEDNNAVCPADPVLNFNSDEMDQRKQLSAAIDTFADEQVALFITGGKPMSEFDKFVEDLNEMGADDLIDIYNTAYERYKGN